MYPYYRFSTALDGFGWKRARIDYPKNKTETVLEWHERVDLELCQKWMDHFMYKGVASAITRKQGFDNDGASGAVRWFYDLWVIGTEKVPNGSKYRVNSEKMSGEVVDESPGFIERSKEAA